MAEPEHELRELARELRWPTTPPFPPRLAERGDAWTRARRSPSPGRRRMLVVAAAIVVLALAVALSVRPARSAILRLFHLGGVTVERVDVLQPASRTPLTAGLGPIVSEERARTVLRGPVRLPPGTHAPELHVREGVVSIVLTRRPPVLLSEFRSPEFLLKKIAGSGTRIVWTSVAGEPALWLVGARHEVVLPAAPPRLAGNVLVWYDRGVTYRLEGPSLTRGAAVRLARAITGT
jgi:hypothetical protein